jgi:hypothetical protein
MTSQPQFAVKVRRADIPVEIPVRGSATRSLRRAEQVLLQALETPGTLSARIVRYAELVR